MQELIAGLMTSSVKRLVVLGLGVGAVFFHDKFGVSLTDAQIASIGVMISTYIIQSGLNAAKNQGFAAAELITPGVATAAVSELAADPNAPAIDPKALNDEITALVTKFTTKVTIILLCLGIALHGMPSYAADDAPRIDLKADLKAGQTAPFDGTLRSPSNDQAIDQALVSCNTQNESLIKSNIQWPIVVTFVAAALVTGAAAATGVCFASRGCK